MPDWLATRLPDGWGSYNTLYIAVGLTVATAIVTLLLVGFILIRLPSDYFTNPNRPMLWANQHPFLRWPLTVLKNVLGIFLIILGILLSLPGVPGQGFLTILIGAMLLDFPGKSHVERWVLRRRGLLSTINRLRARKGREPLQLDAVEGKP